MSRSRTIYVLLLYFAAVTGYAQTNCTHTLSGIVVEAHSREPVPFANIYIPELKRGTVSDSLGRYRITELCAGAFVVQCTHLSCEPIETTINIYGNTSFSFHHEHRSEALDSAVVIGNRPIEESTQSKVTLKQRELDETRGQSLGQSLTKVTGVNSFSTGNSISKPVIHGLHSNRVLILNNGVRQEGQQWGNEHAPEIDPFIADELTVVKGANSVRYGPDAIAGVVLVNPKPLRKKPGLGGELNLVGFSNGIQGVASSMLEGNLRVVPELSWRLQGTIKRGGNINSPDYHLKNTGISERNFSAQAGYSKNNFGVETFYSQFNTDIGIFSAAHIGNLTDLQRAFEADEPLDKADFTYEIGRPWQRIEHELFKASGYVQTSPSSRLEISFARQYNKRLEYDSHLPLNDSLAALNLPALQFEITTHTADVTWKHNRDKALKGELGISGIYQGNTYEGRFFIPNFRKQGGGAFLIERWKPDSSKWEVEAGARIDYIHQQVYMWEGDVIVSPIHEFMNVSGNLGTIYKHSENLKFRVNAGSAWRPPNVNELYSNGLHHGAAAVEIGDTSMQSEHAYNVLASVEYVNKKLTVQVDGYYNHIQDFIYLKPTLTPTLSIRGAFPTFIYTQTNANIKGVDYALSYKVLKQLTYSSKGSLLHGYNQTAKEDLILMPANRFENGLEYNVSGTKKLKDLYIGGAVQNVLKQNRVPANSDFAPPPDGYTLVSVNAGLTIPAGKQSVQLGVSVNNLLNTRYRDYLNRFRYYADEMGINVSLRIKVLFDFSKTKHQHEHEE